jgi:hypothetical protein
VRRKNDMDNLKEYAKVTERATLSQLPPNNIVDITVLFRRTDVILQIGNQRWSWPEHKWERASVDDLPPSV